MLIILPSSSKARGVLTTPTHLGLMLTVCQETVCTDPENNTANFVSIFESQTVSRQSGQVPSQHCIGGRGGGGRGSSDCQGMWPEIRHFSHLS